jgi:predicted site-specific integrase-resolvase
MRDNNLITKSIRKASSLKRYAIRAKKDACLHDDVGYFMIHHQQSISRLVEMLLNNDFTRIRFTDPSYPV